MGKLLKKCIASILSVVIFTMSFNSVILASNEVINTEENTQNIIEQPVNLDTNEIQEISKYNLEQNVDVIDNTTQVDSIMQSDEILGNDESVEESQIQDNQPKTITTLAQEQGAKDVTHLIREADNYPIIKQDGRIIGEDESIDYTKVINVGHKIKVPVIGDEDINEDEKDTYAVNGDYILLPIPNGLKISNTISKQITFNDDGTIIKVADLTLSNEGAKIVFNEAIEDQDLSNLELDFSFDLLYDRDNKEFNQPGTHIISILNKHFLVEIPDVKPTVNLQKSRELNYQKRVIDWKVKVNISYPDGTSVDLNGYDFFDNLTNVGEYVENSFKISSIDDKSNAKEIQNVILENNILKYNFTQEHGDTQYLYFSTKVPEDKIFSQNASNISNKAQIFKDGKQEAQASATVNIPRVEWISKTGNLNLEQDERYIDWTIVINKDSYDIGTINIEDVLPEELDWVSAKWQIFIEGQQDPQEIDINAKPINDIYTLENVTGKVNLVIRTKVKDTVSNIGKKQIYNTASMIVERGNKEPIKISSQNRVEVGENPLEKVGVGYDTAKRELTWRVKVENKGLKLGENIKVFDFLVYGDQSSINFEKLEIDNQNCGEFLKTIKASYNQSYLDNSFKLIKGNTKLYLYPVMQDNKKVADLLVLQGENGQSLDLTQDIEYEYKSILNDPNKYAINGGSNIFNNVSLCSNEKVIFEVTAQIRVNSSVIDKDGLIVNNVVRLTEENISNAEGINIVNGKRASFNNMFNYIDKTATFRIHINNNSTDLTHLGEITIKDTMPQGFEMVDIAEQPFLLYEGTKGNGKQVIANKLVSKEEYEKFLTYEQKGRDIEFKFSKIDKPYLLIVKIKLQDEKALEMFAKNDSRYNKRNDAFFINENISSKPNDWEDFSFRSDFLKKQIDLSDKDTKGQLIWRIEYKPYEIEREGACLKDKLPYGIELLRDKEGNLKFGQDAIYLEELVIDCNGNYAFSKNVEDVKEYITYDNKTRTLTTNFPDISKGYRLVYRTEITGDPGPITNSASIEGAGVGTQDSNATYEISLNDAEATLKRGVRFFVQIKDDKGNPIPGIEVSLINKNGEIIRQAISKANGSLNFKAIPEGEYIIKETGSNLNKYAPSSDEYTVKVVKNLDGKMEIYINEKKYHLDKK